MAAAEGSLDANNHGALQLSSFQGSLSSSSPQAQSFVATRSGGLVSADVRMFLFSPGDAPTQPITMEVTSVDSLGRPAGAALASTGIPAAAVTARQPSPGVPPDPASLVTGTFTSPAQVVAGQRYALVLRTTSTLNYAVSLADGASYADGLWMLGSQFAQGGWFQFGTLDLMFGTYIAPDSVPFTHFTSNLRISAQPGKVAHLQAAFRLTLGTDSDGIKPREEDVRLTLNDYKLTIPSAAFTATGSGGYTVTTVNGGRVTLGLLQLPSGEFLAAVEAADDSLRTVSNPVNVVLSIGNDRGATQVHARIAQ